MTLWAPYTPEDWPEDRPAAEGLEFDWFGADQAGQLAVFSTAGSGPVPGRVFRAGVEAYNAFLAFVQTRELAGATLAFKGAGDYRDWEVYARCGLYAFDFQEVHRQTREARNAYDLIYRPGRPAFVSDLSAALRETLPLIPVIFGEEEIVPAVLLASL